MLSVLLLSSLINFPLLFFLFIPKQLQEVEFKLHFDFLVIFIIGVQCDPSQILTEPGLSGTFTTYDSISFQCAAGRRITARVAVVDSDDVNITCRRDETWSRRDLGCQSKFSL